MIVDKIEQYLVSNNKTLNQVLLDESMKRLARSFEYQLMQDKVAKQGSLPMSSGSKCARKSGYKFHAYPGKPLEPRTIMKFLTGDVIETALVIAAKLAGCNIVDEQRKLGVVVEGREIRGYLDGVLIAPNEDKFILEVKSMGGYAFSRFVKNGMDDTWGYVGQANMYMGATGIHKAIFLCYDLEAGHMAEDVKEFDKDFFEAELKNIGSVVTSTKKKLPERAYDLEESSKLGLVCSYCEYNELCWKPLTVKYNGNKPVFYHFPEPKPTKKKKVPLSATEPVT